MNRKMRLLGSAVALGLAVSACTSDSSGSDGTSGSDTATEVAAGNSDGCEGVVEVNGSSTVEPITTKAADLYAEECSGVEINVGGLGTGDGFQKFCEGETDISDASRQIKDSEAQACAEDTVVGLEVGADDYVPKLYRISELVARIRANLRGYSQHHTPDLPDDELRSADGYVRLYSERHEVLVNGVPVDLAKKEFQVLELLLINIGLVVTRERLLEEVWDVNFVGDNKTLDVHIKRIRKKIEPDPSRPKYVVTERGVGYKFANARPNLS